jgi:hypothetical protein
MARVQICRIVGQQCVDPVESQVDTYFRDFKVQQEVFKATGLTDADYRLTITATGQKNIRSTAAKILVDSFEVTTPGRRYEQGDVSKAKHFAEGDVTIDYFGSWNHNDARVWTEGTSATSNLSSSTVTFIFTGTSVSWIGAAKASAGGTAKISLDDKVEVNNVSLFRPMPIEGFQRTIFRKDGLSKGEHKLVIEVTSTSTAYVVIDAFDVRP